MAGIVIAFKDYKPWVGIFQSKWVGLRWFADFFSSSSLPLLLKNTFIINGLKLIIGFPVPILFAILLNEAKNIYFKKVVQTISYFP